MIKFKNSVTNEQLKKTIEDNGIVITDLPLKNNCIRGWRMTLSNGKTLIIAFTGEVNEWTIGVQSLENGLVTYPEVIDIYSAGDCVEIHRALVGNRNLKAERFLKKYKELALLLNGLVQFGYLKL